MNTIDHCKICSSTGIKRVKTYDVISSNHPDLLAAFGDHVRVRVGLSICVKCGFVFHDRVLSHDELVKVYLREDRITKKKNSMQKQVLLARAVHFIESKFDLAKISSGIDVGSGDFALLEALSKDFPNVKFDAVNISYKEDHYKNIRVFHSMLEDMKEGATTKYQFVILSHILEHVADFKSFFRGLDTIINNKTKLYIEVPFQVGPNILLDRGYHAQHINYFTPLTLKYLLKSFGYKLDNLEFDTQGGYFYYGIPGIIRAGFSRAEGVGVVHTSAKSVAYSVYFLLSPLIYVSGKFKGLFCKKDAFSSVEG
ncbi:MAG: methyltransferase domain-containing protein [Candidatus Moraniibacteriota bacterium]